MLDGPEIRPSPFLSCHTTNFFIFDFSSIRLGYHGSAAAVIFRSHPGIKHLVSIRSLTIELLRLIWRLKPLLDVWRSLHWKKKKKERKRNVSWSSKVFTKTQYVFRLKFSIFFHNLSFHSDNKINYINNQSIVHR